MDEFIIYLEGDVSGKSTKQLGHKKIVTNLSPTTVEAGTYSGELEITVDGKGRVLNIKSLDKKDALFEIKKEDGFIFVKDGKITSLKKEEIVQKEKEVIFPVTSVNGQRGDVTLNIPQFKQEYKTGDYHINMISGVDLRYSGFLYSDGNSIFVKEIEKQEPQSIAIEGDAQGFGTNKIDIKLKTVSVENGGTGVTTKEEAKKVFWPGEKNSLVYSTNTGFSSLRNESGKKFIAQEEGGEPFYTEISQADLPNITHDKLSGIIPVYKGGTGVSGFSKNGIMFVENNHISVFEMGPKDILSVFEINKKLEEKVNSLENYIRNIELRLGDEIKTIKKNA